MSCDRQVFKNKKNNDCQCLPLDADESKISKNRKQNKSYVVLL